MGCDNAKKVLQQGLTRAEQLSKGESPWTKAKGLVVRGFGFGLLGIIEARGAAERLPRYVNLNVAGPDTGRALAGEADTTDTLPVFEY